MTLPLSGQRREALRLSLLARRSAIDVCREGLVQLRSVIVTAPEQLRQELRTLPVGGLLERCSRFRRSASPASDELATRLVLRSLARRIQAATVEAAELEQEILAHVRALAPQLLDERSVGPSPSRRRGALLIERRRGRWAAASMSAVSAYAARCGSFAYCSMVSCRARIELPLRRKASM